LIEKKRKDDPKCFKIVRVKNRLNKGNKDILIKIQFEIKQDKSKFIEYSVQRA